MRKQIAAILVIIMALCHFVPAKATALGNETLHYVISYKWGLVHKDAGEATLSLRSHGSNYQAVLTAKTKPWADKIFQVRDTLRATMTVRELRPTRYEKISHEGGKYNRDIITYTYSGGTIKANVHRTKVRNGKTKVTRKNFSTKYEADDMLSIFYFLRTYDYSSLPNGRSIRRVIFSGSHAEFITIRNLGQQTLKLRSGKKVTALHLRFNFTDDGGKTSSANMDTWISTKAPYVPYQLEGELPVGKVKCYLIDR